jgi:hypothetical protein
MAVSLRDERYRWVVLALYAIAAFLVAVALVFGARWIYRSIHNNNEQTVKQPVSTNQNPQQPAPPTPTTNTPSQPNNSTNDLPNNGPGDVVALFIGSSAVAAGLHYLVWARKIPN